MLIWMVATAQGKVVNMASPSKGNGPPLPRRRRRRRCTPQTRTVVEPLRRRRPFPAAATALSTLPCCAALLLLALLPHAHFGARAWTVPIRESSFGAAATSSRRTRRRGPSSSPRSSAIGGFARHRSRGSDRRRLLTPLSSTGGDENFPAPANNWTFPASTSSSVLPPSTSGGPSPSTPGGEKAAGGGGDLVDRLIELSSGGGGGGAGAATRRSERTLLHKSSSLTGSTLGDIMAGSSGMLRTTADGSPSSEKEPASSSLEARFGISHPLDRMALTANGNLQRLVSSYYDAPVEVLVDRCVRRRRTGGTAAAGDGGAGEPSSATAAGPPKPAANLNGASATPPFSEPPATAAATAVWDRVVRLRVYDRTFCTATSVIEVHDPLCQELVESGAVGLGQLFRFLDLLPEFTLLDAGKAAPAGANGDVTGVELEGTSDSSGGGGFWRNYQLDCNELSCHIHEEFCPGMWQLQPPPPEPSPSSAKGG